MQNQEHVQKEQQRQRYKHKQRQLLLKVWINRTRLCHVEVVFLAANLTESKLVTVKVEHVSIHRYTAISKIGRCRQLAQDVAEVYASVKELSQGIGFLAYSCGRTSRLTELGLIARSLHGYCGAACRKTRNSNERAELNLACAVYVPDSPTIWQGIRIFVKYISALISELKVALPF